MNYVCAKLIYIFCIPNFFKLSDSKNWVLFQPNIVIDAQLGCMWYLNLKLEPLTTLIADKVRLAEFLLQRSDGKPVLINVLKDLIIDQYNGSLLTCLENIFDRINAIYS